MWLITRPFVILFKLLKTIIKAPFKAVSAKRNRTTRKNAKLAADAVRQQNAAAAAAAAAATAAPAGPAGPGGTLVP